MAVVVEVDQLAILVALVQAGLVVPVVLEALEALEALEVAVVVVPEVPEVPVVPVVPVALIPSAYVQGSDWP